MSRFPDPRTARGDVVAIGDDLSVETLRDAYRHGIFPWPHDNMPLPWFSPRRRTVISFDELHVGRSLRKAQKRSDVTYTIDRDFRAVIRACAEVPREDQGGTWIEDAIIDAYTRLHDAGDAHSVEVWRDGKLVGGLYGVDSGGVFTGESMFRIEPDMSKLALLFLIEHLKARGLDWLDIQVLTPHTEALGARLVTRDDFLERLAHARRRGLKLF